MVLKEIEILTDLFEKIKRFIEARPDLGYADVEEWVRDAMRRWREQLTLDLTLGGLTRIEARGV